MRIKRKLGKSLYDRCACTNTWLNEKYLQIPLLFYSVLLEEGRYGKHVDKNFMRRGYIYFLLKWKEAKAGILRYMPEKIRNYT